jgi:hypothetical protein
VSPASSFARHNPPVRLGVARRDIDPAGSLLHGEPGRRDGGIRPADAGAYRRANVGPAPDGYGPSGFEVELWTLTGRMSSDIYLLRSKK